MYFCLTYNLSVRVKTHLCPFNYYIFCRVNTIFQLITSVLRLFEAHCLSAVAKTMKSHLVLLDDFLMIRQMFANKLFLCFRTKVILDFIVA